MLNSDLAVTQLDEHSHRYIIVIFLMLLSSAFVALSSLLGKQLVLSLALPIVMLLRYLLSALILWWVALITSIPRFNKRNLIHYAIRALLGVLSQYALFYYLIYGSILDATLLFMTTPLFVPLISKIMQKIPIQRKQWISVIVGFIGVVFILKPTHNILDWHAVIGLTSGLFNAASQVYYHKILKQSNVKSANLYMYTFSALFALIPVIIFWHPLANALPFFNIHVNSSLILLLISLAIVGISNKSFKGKAYSKVSKASSLTPLLYTAIVFAGLLDWLVYNIVPDTLSIIGAVLITASGFVLYIGKSKQYTVSVRRKTSTN